MEEKATASPKLVTGNFVVIQGDMNRRIGDGGASLWKKTFNTGGRYKGGAAILMLMVKGLTATDSDAEVKINGKSVGKIYSYEGANPKHWFTQIINIGAGILKDGDNELEVEAVDLPNPSAGDLYNDFYIRDVVCFFQRED